MVYVPGAKVSTPKTVISVSTFRRNSAKIVRFSWRKFAAKILSEKAKKIFSFRPSSHSGTNVIKLFYGRNSQERLAQGGLSSIVCCMWVRSEAKLQGNPWPYQQRLDWLERLVRDKRSSFLWTFINYGRKKVLWFLVQSERGETTDVRKWNCDARQKSGGGFANVDDANGAVVDNVDVDFSFSGNWRFFPTARRRRRRLYPEVVHCRRERQSPGKFDPYASSRVCPCDQWPVL